MIGIFDGMKLSLLLHLGSIKDSRHFFFAQVQMNHADFEKEAWFLSIIMAQKLQKASEEEAQGHPITDPAIQALRKHLFTVASRVNRSNQSRIKLHSQIWSTCIMLNPPTLWITINPSDLHDPIAQLFAGKEINMDHFLELKPQGPSADQRAYNIASDPYAAAKFFHFLIQTILETLFGVRKTDYCVRNQAGIFG